MTKLFVTSDLHFGHRNIMKFCPNSRLEFLDGIGLENWDNIPADEFKAAIERMDNAIIDRHNEVVGQRDHTYILGDISFYYKDHEKTMDLLNRMNGTKTIIWGNHDRCLLKSGLWENRSGIVETHEYKRIRVNKKQVILFHYPIYEWDMMHRGSIHLHGHTHGSLPQSDFRMFDVGADTNNLYPYDLEVLVEFLNDTRGIRGRANGLGTDRMDL